jgi:acyl carrier protein
MAHLLLFQNGYPKKGGKAPMFDLTVENRVKAVIQEVLRVDESRLTRETRFREDLGADSLDLVTLVMALEEEFKGSISEKDASAMTTVGESIDFIAKMSLAPSLSGK